MADDHVKVTIETAALSRVVAPPLSPALPRARWLRCDISSVSYNTQSKRRRRCAATTKARFSSQRRQVSTAAHYVTSSSTPSKSATSSTRAKSRSSGAQATTASPTCTRSRSTQANFENSPSYCSATHRKKRKRRSSSTPSAPPSTSSRIAPFTVAMATPSALGGGVAALLMSIVSYSPV